MFNLSSVIHIFNLLKTKTRVSAFWSTMSTVREYVSFSGIVYVAFFLFFLVRHIFL